MNVGNIFGHREKDEILYALFDSKAEVEAALNRLVEVGIPIEDISVMMSDDVHDKEFAPLERTKMGRGAIAGGVLGGTLGGILGGLTVLGPVTGGIGFVVAGPILVLAASGGLIGALLGHGIPEDEAKRLHDALHEGKAMLAVHTHDKGEARDVRGVLAALHGETLELDRRPHL